MAFSPKDHVIMLKSRGGGPAQEYLPVKARIAWFREEFPEGSIETEALTLTNDLAIFRATVRKIKDGAVLGSATGHGSETQTDFRDHYEKAESKSIGRALAALGFGTQFAGDLDEGERIVDSPVARPEPVKPKPPEQKLSSNQADGINALRESLGMTNEQVWEMCQKKFAKAKVGHLTPEQANDLEAELITLTGPDSTEVPY